MGDTSLDIGRFLRSTHPYDLLDPKKLSPIEKNFEHVTLGSGVTVFSSGDVCEFIYLIEEGTVEISDSHGALVSILQPRNHFGERGALRDGIAVTTAKTSSQASLLRIPRSFFLKMLSEHETLARYFRRGQPRQNQLGGLNTLPVSELTKRTPITCTSATSIASAARLMRDQKISCLGIEDNGVLVGILTIRDLTNRVLAEGRDPSGPVSEVMTPKPVTLPPASLGSDVLHAMVEKNISHLPIVEGTKLVGIVTQSDLTRHQAASQSQIVADLGASETVEELAHSTKRLPELLVQLVGAHLAHDVVTRKITDVADIVTRRLVKLAEAEFGPAPVPFCWAACGSQGRREQTGVSDQDNCLIIDDSATADDMVYFQKLAKFVSDGLNACGYVYCPGDMMATAKRWQQPLSVWLGYFRKWIATPDPEAQMLASVMFDLRPIAGDSTLFDRLQSEGLAAAAKNSIFVSHMIGNSLTHTPPLSLLRGFATIKSGEHRNQLDLKMNGVVPVVDIGRIYALKGKLAAVNTRARLDAAVETGLLSSSGGRDLIAAYDTIATVRLEHQANQIRRGEKPDNFLSPSSLPAFERSHLRDAFVVVRSLQSTLGASVVR